METSLPKLPDMDKSISVRPEVERKFVDKRIEERRSSSTRIFTGSVLIIVILYLARHVFVPIALAILLAFLLRPIVSIMERTFLRRTMSVVLALGVAVTLLVLGAWALTVQASSLAREVAAYSGNLEKKLQFLNTRSGGTFALVERTLERVAEAGENREKADLAVRVLPEKKGLADRYETIAPSVEYVAAFFLVIFLVFFMLKDREQLRDKFLKLAGRAHLTVTTQAIGETTFRISRYLFTLSLLNAIFGVIIGLGLWLLGLPHALLWGVLAGLLRFIPYVGAVLSAAIPTFLALAVFPNWYLPAAVLGLFLVADQALGGFIEPLVVGHRVGVSPIALLVATIFWGWLWGPVGLILATPLTVCLTVAGEFIPALRVFSIMFGIEAPLEGYLSFYNRLLTRDRPGALAMADRYDEDNSMEATFNNLVIPTLSFAAEELGRGRVTKVNDHFIKDVTRELIIRLGDRNAPVAESSAPQLMAVSVAGERLSLGTLMLAQLFRAEGYIIEVLTDLSDADLLEYVREVRPAAVMLSCSNPKHLNQGFDLLSLLRLDFADLLVSAGGSAFAADESQTLKAGASYVPKNLTEAKEHLLRELRRSKRKVR